MAFRWLRHTETYEEVPLRAAEANGLENADVEAAPEASPDQLTWKRHCFLLLVTVPITIVRITCNVLAILHPKSDDADKLWLGDGETWPVWVRVVDGVLRPCICAASFVPFCWLLRRNSAMGGISILGCFWVAFWSIFMDIGVDFAEGTKEDLGALTEFRLLSRFPLFFMALLQLGSLPIVAICALGFLIAAMLGLQSAGEFWGLPLFWTFLAAYSLLLGCALLFEAHNQQQLFEKTRSKDEGFGHSVGRTLWLLRLSAVMTFLDGAYLAVTSWPTFTLGLSRAMVLTLDNLIVLVSIFVKADYFEPNGAIDQLQVMIELKHMALTHGRRIAFPGKVNLESQHCVVSFPGKYAEEWDDIVRISQKRHGACSLACIFLTDEASGLGKHQENPEQPGQCWCQAIYGRLPANVYLRILEDPSSISEEELKFKEDDARAMGLIFLKREDHSDEQWQKAKEEAKLQAEQKCQENQGLAPWGCYWFHAWLRQVEEAKRHNQKLHVFYFENMVGCGKVPWTELSNQSSVRKAHENSGLGTSQTAEVAYLQHQGYHFEEHDVKDFYEFMNSHSS